MFVLTNWFTAYMSSSRGKGKRPTTSDQNLVVPDGKDVHIQYFWKERQNDSIALTRDWPQFYRRYKINLDSMLYFKHIGNSDFQVHIFTFGGHTIPTYQQLLYENCINNPFFDKVKAIDEKFSTKCPFFVMDLTGLILSSHLLRHPLFFVHGYIEVEATYTKFSGTQNSSFGIISGSWENFASLCNFKPGGVGTFKVILVKSVTILQVRCH
ncbi:hypothetical protein Ahy_A01g002556 isoform A [Arachis hypogaea]|uniref:TF-B3 domain-containing protein n=1 Tax=Arachis hypogaea TaxID=3818 RepID=A0A445EQW6_ARAHY|nr:hypothetical protein Ahy_A01g002556 isoform A [Arachis hypogaea]